MKLRYFISVLASVCYLATACDTTEVPGDLANIQVSSSYVAIPENKGEISTGGTATITVTATTDWSFDDKALPEWLTVSPVSGKVGETKVSFTAGEAVNTNTVTLKINADGAEQYIVVTQMVGDGSAKAMTAAEVAAAPDGKKVMMTGVCTSIANTVYGNWYIEDSTGSVYVYGTLDSKGQTKNFASLGLEVGDVVTVQGPKKDYSGVIELLDVTVVKIVKSLIKLEQTAVDVAKEGGELRVAATVKGSDLHVDNMPEWLSFYGNDGGELVFNVAANNAGARKATLSISSGTSTVTLDITQAGSIIEASIADFLAAEVGETLYKLTGVVTSVASATYGNINIKDATGEVYVYGVLTGEGGESKKFDTLGVEVGDIVTVIGKRAAYNGNPQVGGAYYVEHANVTTVTVAEFLTKADSKEVWYMLTGTVSNIANATYGNFDLVDSTGTIYVYGLLTGYNGVSKQFSTLGVEAGDTITVIGKRASYNGAAQVGNGFYVSHTKATI